MAKIYPLAKLFLPTTFNSAIHQTLTLPNIPVMQCVFVSGQDIYMHTNAAFRVFNISQMTFACIRMHTHNALVHTPVACQ